MADELKKARVVARDGQEIMFCDNPNDAGAFVQHTYGVTPWEAYEEFGVTISSIVARGPKPGDGFADGEQRGVLCRQAGRLAACYDARAFREHDHVSVSGGPIPFVEPEQLRFHGLTDVRFWRWKDGLPGAGLDGHYMMRVPLWRIEK